MRRISTITLALMITLAALGGCGSKNSAARANEFLAQVEAASTIELSASVTASYGDRVLEYGLSCVSSAGETDITVTSPELIAGISAHMDADSDYLSFDGIILDTGSLDASGLSPLSALPAMLEGWREGYLSDCGTRDGLLLLNIVMSETLSQALYLDAEALQPRFAELISDGSVVISCHIESIAFS